MDSDKTPQQPADDEGAQAAPDLAKNFAQASREASDPLAAASIRESVQGGIREARARVQDVAASSARRYVREAQASADDALTGARAYARDAVNATGKKIRYAGGARWQGEQFVTEQPVRAALIAVAGGALLTAVFIAFLRGGRR